MKKYFVVLLGAVMMVALVGSALAAPQPTPTLKRKIVVVPRVRWKGKNYEHVGSVVQMLVTCANGETYLSSTGAYQLVLKDIKDVKTASAAPQPVIFLNFELANNTNCTGRSVITQVTFPTM